MAKRKTDQPALVRHDGGLCANFVNTASRKRRSIGSYADLVAWGHRSGVLSSSDAQRLERMAGERPADAEAVLGQTRELLACLRRILLALARRRKPVAADLGALSEARGAALSAQHLVPAGGGWVADWGDRGGDDLDRMLWPVVLSTVETLSPKYYGKVLQCAGDDCDLILVDRAPGRVRKMCHRCGSRHRSRKHYQTKVRPRRLRREAQKEARRLEWLRQYEERRRHQEPRQENEEDAKPLNRNVC